MEMSHIIAAPKEPTPLHIDEVIKIRPGLGKRRRDEIKEEYPTLPLNINIRIARITDDGMVVLSIEGEEIIVPPNILERIKPVQ